MSITESTSTIAPANPRAISTCPRCRSIDVAPVTPIPNASFREAAEVAWSEGWAGRKRLAARHLVRWACVQAANLAARDTLCCSYCGHRWEDRS